MGALVLDSSVVIAFSTIDDGLHPAAMDVIGSARLAGDYFILPASVLAEALVHPFRQGDGLGRSSERELVALFGPVRGLDQEVAAASARLRGAHRSLRLPDALVVATGIVDGATTLTYDRRLGGVDPSVRVLVP